MGNRGKPEMLQSNWISQQYYYMMKFGKDFLVKNQSTMI